MKHTKISIVTPSFNQGQFLEACIDSVLSQGYPNLEYMVLDGGSTDHSISIIKKYKKYLTYWRSHHDEGHYAAIDEGLKRSSGDVMGWLNSDDMLHKDSLNILHEVFSTYPSIEFATGQRIGFNKVGDIAIPYFPLQQWTRESILKDSNFRTPHMFVMQEATYWRRSLWQNSGGYLDLSYKLAADFELWCRFLRISPLVSLNHRIGGFRDYGESQKSKALFTEYVSECRQIIAHEKSFNLPDKFFYSNPVPVLNLKHSKELKIVSQLNSAKSYSVSKNQSLTRISVVVPLWDDCRFLEQAIHSVLIQKWPNLQLILVCSPSMVSEVNNRLMEVIHLIEVLEVECPNSIFHLIDYGLKNANGDILACLPPTDVYQEHSLYVISELFKRKPDVDWVTGCASSVDNDGKLFSVTLYPPITTRQNLLEGNFFDPFLYKESIFFRRALWKESEASLDLNYKLAADHELFLRFSRKAKLHTLSFVLASYRDGIKDRYQNMSLQTIQEIVEIIQKEKSLGIQISFDISSPAELISRLDN